MGPCCFPGWFQFFPLFVFLFENYESETTHLPSGAALFPGQPEEMGGAVVSRSISIHRAGTQAPPCPALSKAQRREVAET